MIYIMMEDDYESYPKAAFTNLEKAKAYYADHKITTYCLVYDASTGKEIEEGINPRFPAELK